MIRKSITGVVIAVGMGIALSPVAGATNGHPAPHSTQAAPHTSLAQEWQKLIAAVTPHFPPGWDGHGNKGHAKPAE